MEKREYKIMFNAEEQHWWYVALHALILRLISQEHKLKGPLKILDAGCGTGRLCQLMAPFGAVYGCDVSDLAVEYCRKRDLPSIFKADLNSAQLGEGRYDVITLIDVLYHKGIENEERVLKKLYTALKPGGMLILQLPAYEFLKSTHDLAVHTNKRFTKTSTLALLRSVGLNVERITYRVTTLFLPIAIYRMIRKTLFRIEYGKRNDSDVEVPRSMVNKGLLALALLENKALVRHSLPFGTSVFSVARKTRRRNRGVHRP